MLKIDLHIHTMATAWEESFEFSLEQLEQHVSEQRIDVIAITNHNTFDLEQYEEIREVLAGKCAVFPGVEVSALKSHILIIDSEDNVRRLKDSCEQLNAALRDNVSRSLENHELQSIFPWIGDAIVIPHYQKDPGISQESLAKLGQLVTAVETSSLGKARRLSKQGQIGHPAVCFTDYRFGVDEALIAGERYRPTGVFLTTDSVSFGAIKSGIKDGVRFSSDGSEDIEFAPGLTLVKGVNLILGRRSTGKSYTLKRVAALFEESDVYHITQGELVKEGVEDAFYDNLGQRFSGARRSYMSRLRPLMSEAKHNGNAAARSRAIRDYLKSLKSYAESSSQSDCYSRCALHHAVSLKKPKSTDTAELIDATKLLLKSSDNADLIEKHVGRERLCCLLKSLVERSTNEAKQEECIELSNKVIKRVRQSLKVSAVDVYPEPYLCEAFEKEAYSRRLSELLDLCWTPKLVADDGGAAFSDYSIKVSRCKFARANDVKAALGADASVQLGGITNKKSQEYIDRLISLQGDMDLSLGLFDVKVRMEDEKGAALSGGQRTECVFVGKLNEAYGKSVVLIDEPESSFDNPFLSKTIAGRIRELAKSSTVVVATHNQVLGFDLKPEKVFVARFDRDTGRYSMLSGSPHDRMLTAGEYGESTSDAMLEILEAGKVSYDNRRTYYGGLGQ